MLPCLVVELRELLLLPSLKRKMMLMYLNMKGHGQSH